MEETNATVETTEPTSEASVPETDTLLSKEDATEPKVDEVVNDNSEEVKDESKEVEEKTEPIEYDLSVPEGVPYNEAELAEYKGIAAELGLSQEGASKLMELAVKNTQNQIEQHNEVQKQWVADIKADPEFGGNNLQSTVRTARSAIDTYGGPGVLALLESTGLGNNPEFIKMFAKIGKRTSEDSTVNGKPSGGKKTAAQLLYPSMN